MSKSKGNVVTPTDLLLEFGSDAVRYWAASGRPGTDTAFDTGQHEGRARELAIKLLNARKFALGIWATADAGHAGHRGDRRGDARRARGYRPGGDGRVRGVRLRASAGAGRGVLLVLLRRLPGAGQGPGLRGATRCPARPAPARPCASPCRCCIRLFAPILPFVTEEVWSWWNEGSVHRAAWPTVAALGTASGLGDAVAAGDREVLAVAADVIAAIRKAKSEAKVSMRTEVTSVQVAGPAALLDRVCLAEGDLRAAGRMTKIEQQLADTESAVVTVTL